VNGVNKMLKQYVFIPLKSKMSAGKIASQACHASYMALRQFRKWDWFWLKETKWREGGMCVIVLTCKDSNHLMQIGKYMEQWKIPHHVYIDEGFTEVEPFTATAVATGILTEKQQEFFQKFKMYGSKKRRRNS
jgi:peptidyl-tRNA hydrolase